MSDADMERGLPYGVAFGLSLGNMFGVAYSAVTDQWGTGIAMGNCLGLAVGIGLAPLIGARMRRSADAPSQNEERSE